MTEILQIATALCLGLFCGSMLTEAMILVPYWRRMEAAEFLRLHGTMGPRLYRYFAPLTIAATVVPIATAVVCLRAGLETSMLSATASAIMAVILGIYFFYFKAANESFATGSVGVTGLAGELRRWAAWHWTRTLLSIGAFALSLLALTGASA